MRKAVLARSVSAWLLAAALLTGLCASALAADQTQRQTVRIGIAEYPGYAYQDENGRWAGIDVEYIETVAQYGGFNAEFIPASSAAAGYALLDSGEVDILADVAKTDEREANYLFSAYEMGATASAVVTRPNDDRWVYGDIRQMNDRNVGVLTDSPVKQQYLSWCAQYECTPDITEYSDSAALFSALNRGKVDAVLVEADFAEGYRTILRFSPTPYYLMLRRDETALRTTVDTAMSQILSQSPFYLEELSRKYLAGTESTEVVLSRAEKTYVSQHPTVTVAVLDDDAPYYYRGKNGVSKGILPDYYSEIAALTGLQFRFAVYAAQEDAVAAVKSGEADLLGMYSAGMITARAEGLAITRSYSTTTTVLLTRAGTSRSQIRTIAVKARSVNAIQDRLDGELADAALIGCNTADACFRALRDGKADAMICGLPSATWLLNQTNAAAYSISPMSTVTLELCGAADEDNDTLCSLLNKAIAASVNTFDGIVSNDTMQETGLQTAISRIPAVWIAGFAVVMVSLVTGLILALSRLRRREKERSAILAAKAEAGRQQLRAEAMERSAEGRNQFFSNISHDMRTPLNAIIGFSDLAEEKVISPEVRDYLTKIRASGRLLLELINDTLTISKAGSGKLELHPEPVDTEELGASIVTLIRTAAEQKGIAFSMDKSGYRPRTVLADRLSVQKIFLNLLNNAVKYTHPGGHISVVVRDEAGTDGAPETVFVIRDDGVGISEEFLPHIFEPFAQEKQTGYETSGTGLGLAIVKQLVDLMGGTVEAESEKGKGTAFTVRLRFRDAPAEQRSGARPADRDWTDLFGRRVLLCEDNALNREIACALLQEKGVRTDTAENGRLGTEAFARSGIGAYDAVLMDLRMPVMNGYEAARAIRAMDRADAKTVPILAMTADAFADDVQKCLDAGMDGHIAKPVDPERLYSALLDAVERPGT